MQWVQALKERSKTSKMHLRVFGPSNVVEKVEGWRDKAADEKTHKHGKHVLRDTWRDDKHGKPMGR